MKKKDVLIIIVTYNGAKWIRKCIESIYESNYEHFQIFVVDNASSDDTIEILNAFPNIILHKSPFNLGFGQANNIGMKYALEKEYDYVFLLNQDTWIEKETITNLVQSSLQNPDYGIIAPMHYFSDEKSLEYFFSTRIAPNYCKNLISDYIVKGKENMDSVYSINFIHAAAWLINNETLKNVGGFDPLFFHYGEDNNYCQRVLFQGRKIGINPHSIMYHDCKVHNPDEIKSSEQEVKSRILQNLVGLADVRTSSNQPVYLAPLRLFKKTIIDLFKVNFRDTAINFKVGKEVLSLASKITDSKVRNRIKGPNHLR